MFSLKVQNFMAKYFKFELMKNDDFAIYGNGYC